jgi:hypothetical protein
MISRRDKAANGRVEIVFMGLTPSEWEKFD